MALSLALQAAAQDDGGADLALSLVNDARRAEGLDDLALEPALMEAAKGHAEDMLARDYYGHDGPEGGTASDRVLDAGGAAGITRRRTSPAARNRRAFHGGWMRSLGHPRNILAPGLDAFGFGIVARAGEVYALQTFAGAGTAPGGNESRTKPAQAREADLATVNAERRHAGRPPLEACGALDTLAERMADAAPMENGALSRLDEPFGLLPDLAQGWTGLAVSAAVCTGCGASPARGDGGRFGNQMQPSGNPESFNHFGLSTAAKGEGRKIAVGVFGHP